MTPIDARKDSMGYQSTPMRARCALCAHVTKTGHPTMPLMTCRRGGFYVAAFGVCREYAPRDGQPQVLVGCKCPAKPLQPVPVRSKTDAGATAAARGLRASGAARED